ncbi:hypothetical protein EIK77_004467 [Talaromyces pinophilus]|nr:hypothetical protein EIK77_004467 [Talaromyces pinophilus]
MSPTNNETQSDFEPDVNLWKRESGRGYILKTVSSVSEMDERWELLKNVTPPKQDGLLPPLFYEFIKRIANDDQSLIPSNSSSPRWYYTYLNLKLEAIDPQLLRYVKTATVTSGSQEESTVFALFPTIVDLIKNTDHVSIATIAKELKVRDQLQYTTEEAPAVYQLLFILIGLITFFYEPILSPEKGLLQINVGDAENDKRKRRSLRGLTWSSEITIDKGSKLSLADLLRNLCGGKLPISYNAGPRVGTSGDILETTNLNYYTLSKVANIQILWVDSLLQHLDFDRRSKTLKIFRFPSFCYLLCFGDLDKTYLDR